MTVSSDLAALGVAFGGPRWAQGPGGNVSVKEHGTLYVKASGVRVAAVASVTGHVGVPLEDATKALAGDAAADERTFARSPRPSLETYFHAIGGRIVAHTHPISALLAACASRVEEVGVDGRIPYERPGRGLAVAIAEARKSGESDVLLLDSHGLLVYADDVATAVEKSRAVDAACLAKFDADPTSFDALLARYQEHPVSSIEGGFARRLPPREASGRYLFPDAAVYASVIAASEASEATAARALAEMKRALLVSSPRGDRIAVARTGAALEYALEVAAAHDWVEDVLVARGCPRYLPEDEPAKILGLPSEQYRMKL